MGARLDLAKIKRRLNTRFLGRPLVYHTSVGSTMDLARQEADQGAPEGTLILAEEQMAGRGRFGRQWLSPAGKNLYLTLILRPAPERLRSLSVVAPLAISLAVEETTGLSPRIKWPNDVLLAGRKLAGVLMESSLAGAEVRYALVGIGLNVNLEVEAYPDIADIATSLRQELGREVSREEVLAALLNRFEELYTSPLETVFAAWRQRLETLGRQVRVRLPAGPAGLGEQVEEGLAEEVDAQGSLILRRPDGSRVTLAAGEVTLRE